MKTKTWLIVMGCVFGLALVWSPAATGQGPQAEGPPVMTHSIPGVVAAGVRVERVWTGLRAADGLISEPDGTLLLPEQRADRISRFSPDGTVTLYLEDTNEAGGIAFDAMGRLISVERRMPQVRVLVPERRVLADTYEGQAPRATQRYRRRPERGRVFYRGT